MASGIFFTPDGRDVTMDVLTNVAVHPCPFVIYRGSRDPDSGRFGPDEVCDEPVLDAVGVYCDAHAWAVTD